MIDEIKSEIDAINSNIKILPTKTKKNKEKYIEYLDINIERYSALLKECTNEINSRVERITKNIIEMVVVYKMRL